jgi:hypothetical protein
VSFDLEYIRRQSLREDLRIMLKTLPVVLFRRGPRLASSLIAQLPLQLLAARFCALERRYFIASVMPLFER